jgi:translation initiation factor IF-2
MAKLRVYELARQLNLTNKALLDKMIALGLPARSHASALEDDVVEKVKAGLAQPRHRAEVEEKRVGSTVVRRRRRVEETGPVIRDEGEDRAARDLPPADIEVQAPESAGGDAPAKEAEVLSPVEEALEKAAPGKETPAEEPVREDAPVERIEERLRRLNKGTPAKIIEKPRPPALEDWKPEEAAPEAADVQETARPPVEAKEETPPAETSAEAPPAPEPSGEPAETEPGTAPALESAAPPAVLDDAAQAADGDAAKGKGKKKKRRERDMPARIISLPEAPAKIISLGRDGAPHVSRTTPPPPQSRTQQPTPPRPPRGTAATPAAPGLTKEEEENRERRKRKNKKKAGTQVPPVVALEEEAPNPQFFKKKIQFRKKAVVEGADLYDGGGSRGRKGKRGGKAVPPPRQKTLATIPKAIKRRVRIDEAILLSELAKRINVKGAEIIKKLMEMGTMATLNQSLDFETASLIAVDYGYEVEKAGFEEETVLKTHEDQPDQMADRPPVVTVMGHVDHGKTSLLDAIRETKVTEGEAGGITQHIGAYVVDIPRGRIVFLDTPGHEAFTAMRARGASVTDIVVLVVAADDGVMPQTVEAIHHAKAANVPIIVAVNKMDKPDANPERVTRQLSEHGLVPEDWGGETIFAQVSAKQRIGIDNLLEMILLQSEILELKANADKPARGHVIEARMDQARGPVATILVQEGTLRAGDHLVCGVFAGKIRAMQNARGEQTDVAGPSIPVEILGLSGVPNAGDEILAVASEKVARQISGHRQEKLRSSELAKTTKVSLDNLFEQMGKTEKKDLNMIIRADVQGSVEALRESLAKLSGESEEVAINVVHAGTGTVTESDVALAEVSKAIVLAFNVRPASRIQDMAQAVGVEIRFYDVIYNALKEIKDAIAGMMESTFVEHVTGRAEVRNTFTIPKVGTIAGSAVIDGKVERGGKARLIRDGVVVADSRVGSLKRFKDDVKEVLRGYECGIGLDNFNDIKVGDVIEAYYMEEIRPTLD